MNKPKRTSIHQMLAEQKEASIPEQPAKCGLFVIWSQQMTYFYASAALTMTFWFSLSFLIHLG